MIADFDPATAEPADFTADDFLKGEQEAPRHLTKQSAAAWYFGQLAGDKVRFDHGRRRWLVWGAHRWVPDEDGSVNRLWLKVAGQRFTDALQGGEHDRERLIKEAQLAGATNSAIDAGLDIASSMKPIATTADAWDPDPWLLGCDNGVVNLRTGELRNGKPEDMISRSTGTKYDPDATCARWDSFLPEVFGGDKALAGWYQLLIGASLIGVTHEILAIHYGGGNNGKTVAVDVLLSTFGGYAVVIPVETLMNATRAAGEATPDLMKLRGARIVFASEPDKLAKLEGGVLKRLASNDRMTGRALYGSPQTWAGTHTIHLSTNHLPTVDDATVGFWRRIALLPWAVHFLKKGETGAGPSEDPGLTKALLAEGAGVLAWAVRGAVAIAAGASLSPFPDAVRAKTAEYQRAEDVIGGFIAECVTYGKDAEVVASALYSAYVNWCGVEGIDRRDRLGPKKFPVEFLERGGVRLVHDERRRRVFLGAGETLSTNPRNPRNRGAFPEVPIRGGFSESLESASDSADSAEVIFEDRQEPTDPTPPRTCPSCRGPRHLGSTCEAPA